MKWFVMKKVDEISHYGYSEIVYHKASKYFSTKKKAQNEMKKMKKKHPKTYYKIGGEPE